MEDFEWNINSEGYLLESMVGLKPIGVSKHLQMLCIWDKFTKHMKKEVLPSKVWEHLQTLYDLETLEEIEELPFPNEVRDFSLPDTEYQQLKIKKEEKIENEKKVQKIREAAKNTKEIKKEEGIRTPIRNVKEKEATRRDSKDKETVKETKTPVAKKEIKKEPVESSTSRSKTSKSRSSLSSVKDESKNSKGKTEETPPRPPKRPTRGSLKPDETLLGGKASPVTVNSNNKRRRI